jgi:pyruvate dehydrogenase E1 component alpha subunit
VFVCENNLYAQFTPQRIHAKSADLYKRALAYDIPGVQADGQDALAVFQVASEAVERARTDGGPTLIELKTYRYTGHAISNPICAIGRPDEEIEAWKLRDPIVGFETFLLEAGRLSREELQSLRAAAVARVDAAVEFAESSPLPSPETALENVYTELPAGAVL